MDPTSMNTTRDKKVGLASAPGEIVLEVLSYFDLDGLESLRTVLCLRQTCRRLCEVTTNTMRGKFTLRLGRSFNACLTRMNSFIAGSISKDFVACFSGLILDARHVDAHLPDVITEVGTPGVTTRTIPDITKSQLMEYVLTTVIFLKQIGTRLTHLELASDYEEDSEYARGRRTADRFFRAVAVILLHVSPPERGYLRNVRSLKTVSENGRFLRHIIACPYDKRMEEIIDKACMTNLVVVQESDLSVVECIFTLNNPDWWVLNRGWDGWETMPDRRALPLFHQLDTLHMHSFQSRMMDYYDRERKNFIEVVNAMLPMAPARKFTLEGWTQPHPRDICPEMLLEAVKFFSLRSTVWYGTGMLSDTLLGKMRRSLRSLELINVSLKLNSWRPESEELERSESPEFAMDVFFDGLLEKLPALESLRIESMGYVAYPLCYIDRNSWMGMLEAEQKKIAQEPIAGCLFRVPILTPFSKDLEALYTLRDCLVLRRKEKGLAPYDHWLRFLFEREEVVTDIIRIGCEPLRDLSLSIYKRNAPPVNWGKSPDETQT